MVMIPKPPTWIRARIAPSPKSLQYVPVSTTVSPVTQTADVDVKRAVTKSADVSASEASGRASSTAPITTTAAKAMTTVRAGCAANRACRAATKRPATCFLPVRGRSPVTTESNAPPGRPDLGRRSPYPVHMFPFVPGTADAVLSSRHGPVP